MKPKAIYKALCASLVILTVLSTSITSEAAQCYHWYLKRNKNATPIFPNEAEEIKKYDAIYIDEGVDNNNKKIYLTFDAGYENGNVEKILDVLKAEKIPSAFFLLDNIILKNTDLVKRMADEGHLVCNHTKNHKNLSFTYESQPKGFDTALFL